jgi:hypothetical protein
VFKVYPKKGPKSADGSRRPSRKPAVEIVLPHGSLLEMRPGMQERYTHAVPAMTKKAAAAAALGAVHAYRLNFTARTLQS